MLYQKNLTVPLNTPETDPAEAELTLEEPVITEGEIFFPPGCEGLAHGAIFYGEDRRFPSHRGDWVSANDETVRGPVYFESGEDEPTVIMRGWNEDDTYDHTLYFRIRTLSRDQAYWRRSIGKLARTIDRLLRWMGGG